MPSLTVLDKQSPIVSQFLRELRDVEIQKDPQRFEQNLIMLGTLLGYELSSRFSYQDHETQTPLGTANTPLISEPIVLTTILRAGLPVHAGLRQIFKTAEVGFIGAARTEGKAEDIKIELGYVAAPGLADKTLIVADTMLATGKSLVASTQELIKTHGKPAKIFIACVIASQNGIDYLATELPEAEIIACCVDKELNDKAYIIPGLGDAGDLLYGPKL